MALLVDEALKGSTAWLGSLNLYPSHIPIKRGHRATTCNVTLCFFPQNHAFGMGLFFCSKWFMDIPCPFLLLRLRAPNPALKEPHHRTPAPKLGSFLKVPNIYVNCAFVSVGACSPPRIASRCSWRLAAGAVEGWVEGSARFFQPGPNLGNTPTRYA